MSYCLVKVLVAPAINIWVGLPADGSYNGRFMALGGGGFVGSVSAPTAAVTPRCLFAGRPQTRGDVMRYSSGISSARYTTRSRPALPIVMAQGGCQVAVASVGDD